MNLYKIVTKNKKENHHIRLQVRHKSPIVCNGLNLKRVIHVWQGHYQGANLSIKLLLSIYGYLDLTLAPKIVINAHSTDLYAHIGLKAYSFNKILETINF